MSLQPQPTRALGLLVRRAGETISREELREHLWGREHHIDFEQGINFTIRKIRAALGDDPVNPQFVETLPRVGYRFVAQVEVIPTEELPRTHTSSPPPRPLPTYRKAGLVGLVVLIFLTVVAFGWRPTPQGLSPVADALGAPVAVAPPQASVPQGPYEAYLRGRFLIGRGDQASVLQGIEALEEATAAAPEFATGHAAIAAAYLKLMFTHPAAEIAPVAEAAARRAVELDDQLAEGHLALAQVYFYFLGDWSAAGREFRRALELQPGGAAALHGYGLYLSSLGRHDEAIASIRRAVDLDPATVYISSDLAQVYFWSRRYVEAATQARANLTVEEDHLPSHGVLIDALAQMGRLDEALQEHNALFERLGRPTAGDWAEAQQQALDFLTNLRAKGRNLDVAIAEILQSRGESDLALTRLARACDERSDWTVPFIAVNPSFDGLRADARYTTLGPCLAPLAF